MNKKILDREYVQWLKVLKQKVLQAQLKAAAGTNRVLIRLYWDLGREITEREKEFSYGENFISKVAKDLNREFPEIKGFSRRNLYAIRQWYLFFSGHGGLVHQPGAQLPWRHQLLLIQKVKKLEVINLYANAALKNNWSRDTLDANIKSGFHLRAGKAEHNFRHTLPSPQSDLAIETIKDPYHFDFLGLNEASQEREIEQQLTKRITEFMLEPGNGFAFVGRQFKIEVGESDYFLDLLFYHLQLRCFIIIELKACRFKPEFVGKLNFYLSAADAQLKRSDDNPSIGILLCRTKDKIEAEYALRDLNKPIGVSSFELSNIIPESLKSQLPSIEEMEEKLLGRMND
ncbi:MAG: YhcG family protein [Chitinophagales bacterium]